MSAAHVSTGSATVAEAPSSWVTSRDEALAWMPISRSSSPGGMGVEQEAGVVTVKLVVIGVVLAGKAALHWELIDGKPAKWVEFGAESLHLVFSGIAELFV